MTRARGIGEGPAPRGALEATSPAPAAPSAPDVARLESASGALADVSNADSLRATHSARRGPSHGRTEPPPFGSPGSPRCLAPSTVPPARGRTRWTHDLGGDCSAPAVGLDGTIYAIAGRRHHVRELAAVRSDGVRLGPRTVGPLGSELVLGGRGDIAVCTTPAAGADLVVSIPRAFGTRRIAGLHGVRAMAADRRGNLYAIDGAGQLIGIGPERMAVWRAWSSSRRPFAHVAAGPGRVFVTGADGLHAFEDGHELWHLAERAADVPPAVDRHGTVYWVGRAGAGCEILGAMQDGRLAYRARLRFELDVCALTPAPAGSVYALGRDGRVRRFGAGGELERVIELAAAGRPVVAQDGGLLLPGADGLLYALDAEGEVRWSLRVGDEGACNSPAVAGDGTIYATSAGGRLRAID